MLNQDFKTNKKGARNRVIFFDPLTGLSHNLPMVSGYFFKTKELWPIKT